MARTPPANLLDLRGTHNLQDRTVASGTNAWNYNWLRIWSCNCCTSFNNLSTLAGRPCRYHVVVVDLMSGASCRSAGRPRSLGSNQQGVRGDLAARAATNGFGYSSSLSGSLATCLLSFHWTVRQHRQHWRDRASWARPSAAWTCTGVVSWPGRRCRGLPPLRPCRRPR